MIYNCDICDIFAVTYFSSILHVKIAYLLSNAKSNELLLGAGW